MSSKQQTSTQTISMEGDKEEIFEKVLLETRLGNAMDYADFVTSTEDIEEIEIDDVTIYEIETDEENIYMLKIGFDPEEVILVYINCYTVTNYGEHIFERFPLEEGEEVIDIANHTQVRLSKCYYTGNKIELSEEEIMSHII